MSNTPETDAFIESLHDDWDVEFANLTAYAKKLEQQRNEWRECAERLATVLRDADVIAQNEREDGRREWFGDIGWLRDRQTAIVIDQSPEEELAEFDRLKEASK